PALTWAPEATAQTTVRSPCGKKIDGPERTGLSMSSDATGGRRSSVDERRDSPPPGKSRTLPDPTPPASGANAGGAKLGSTPSTEMTRIEREASPARSSTVSALLGARLARSRMTGGLAKKPSECPASWSRSASHAARGGEGSRTNARKERPAKRTLERAARASDKGGSWR